MTSFQFSIISTLKSLPHILFTLEIVSFISGFASYMYIFDAPNALDTSVTCVVTLSSLTRRVPIRKTSIFIFVIFSALLVLIFQFFFLLWVLHLLPRIL